MREKRQKRDRQERRRDSDQKSEIRDRQIAESIGGLSVMLTGAC